MLSSSYQFLTSLASHNRNCPSFLPQSEPVNRKRVHRNSDGFREPVNIVLLLFRIFPLSLQFWKLLQSPSTLQVLCPAQISFSIPIYSPIVEKHFFSPLPKPVEFLCLSWLSLICNQLELCFCNEFEGSHYKTYCQSLASISYCGIQLSLVKMTHLCTFRRVLIFLYSLLKRLFF